MLDAYFDESERDNGLLYVAGYAFAPAQALKLSKEFHDCFGVYGGFHMKDLVHKKRLYKGISDTEQTRLIKKAVAIVNKRFSYGVAVTVNIREYQAHAPGFIKGLGNAYPFLCHGAMVGIVKLARKHGDCGPIKYVYEAGQAYESEARFAVRQMSLSAELRKQCMYSGDEFLPKADAVPLQAADLLAWEVGKYQA